MTKRGAPAGGRPAGAGSGVVSKSRLRSYSCRRRGDLAMAGVLPSAPGRERPMPDEKPPTGFPEPPGRDPEDRSRDADPHHSLNSPADAPDTTDAEAEEEAQSRADAEAARDRSGG